MYGLQPEKLDYFISLDFPRGMRLLCVLSVLALVTHARIVSMEGRLNHFLSRSDLLLTAVPNTTRYFDGQRLDHFDPQNTKTWTQRYFVNDTFFDPATGPVFLCVGGEGPPLEPTV
jgi:hypothetical protein